MRCVAAALADQHDFERRVLSQRNQGSRNGRVDALVATHGVQSNDDFVAQSKTRIRITRHDRGF